MTDDVVTVDDSGTTTNDSGTTEADAGTTTNDSGTTEADSGTTTNDSGTTEADSGTPSVDAGVCGAMLCGIGTQCCAEPTAPAYGTCYDVRCLSCCMPRTALDAGVDAGNPVVDAGRDAGVDPGRDSGLRDSGIHPVDASVCGAILCGIGTQCCNEPTAPAYGTCYSSRCLTCCMPRVRLDAGVDAGRDAGPGGCTSNSDCSTSQYCESATCGGHGRCTQRPLFCPLILSPVCGCDGRTYGNRCEAQRNGQNVSHPSACGRDGGVSLDAGGPTTCTSNSDCSPREYCQGIGCRSPGQCAGRPDACTALYDPVCGCDGRTYGNACTAASRGVRVSSRGACSLLDAGSPSMCRLVRCRAGYTCCDRPGSTNDGTCFPSNCLGCCR